MNGTKCPICAKYSTNGFICARCAAKAHETTPQMSDEIPTPETDAFVELLKWRYSGVAIEVLHKAADFASDLERRLSTTEKALEEARSERDEARDTNQDLNRRVQEQESKNASLCRGIEQAASEVATANSQAEHRRLLLVAAQATTREHLARIEGLKAILRKVINMTQRFGIVPILLILEIEQALAQQPDGPTAEVKA